MNHLQTIQQVFSGWLFRIPDYQRGYAWGAKQVDDLLEDLDLISVGDEHYAGTLVLHKDDSVGSIMDQDGIDNEVYNVVDGQQRLTTIVMLLDCIRRMLPEGHTLVSGIRKNFGLTKRADNIVQPRLTLNQDTHKFFEKNILSDDAGISGVEVRSQKLLEDAHRRMRRYLANNLERLGEDGEDWLVDLYRKVTTSLRLTVYVVPEAGDVGVIFEVMNNRGRPLSEMEKIKNYLLYAASKMSSAGAAVADEVNSVWSKMFAFLMEAGASSTAHENQCFRMHWLMKYDPSVRSWSSDTVKDFFSIRKLRADEDTVVQGIVKYLDSLRNFVVGYCDIVSPNRSSSFAKYENASKKQAQIRRAAYRLERLDTLAGFIPLVAAVRLRNPGRSDKLLSILDMCERYAVRVYEFADRRADAGQRRLFRLAHELYHQQKTVDQVCAAILQRIELYAPLDEFEEMLEKPADWFSWNVTKYMLYEYEEFLSGDVPLKFTWEQLDRKRDSVEHVLPRAWQGVPYWDEHWSVEEADIYKHDIGNLTLTFNNSSLGTKGFPEKKGTPEQTHPPCYLSPSSTLGEKKFIEHDDWTAKECAERRQELVAWMIKRWGDGCDD